MTSAGGVPLTWSDNGNLPTDGTSSYQWDHANRLIGVTQGADSYVFAYSGLGDRLRQTVNGVPTSYTLDLESGLTQVLSDGTTAFLYGNGRLAEEQPGGWVYHLPDALGSGQQLVAGLLQSLTAGDQKQPAPHRAESGALIAGTRMQAIGALTAKR